MDIARTILSIALLCFIGSCNKPADTVPLDTIPAASINVSGLTRTFVTHLPTNFNRSTKTPLVLCFHGGTGDGKGQQFNSQYNPVADLNNFIVVYPDGLGGWNDGRNSTGVPAYANGIDDVAFIKQLIDYFITNFNVDAKRVYASGGSNGGIFTNYLAFRLSDKLAAVAPVVGSIAEPIGNSFSIASLPLPAIIINGDKDPRMPFDGGFVNGQGGATGSGRVISAENTVKKYVTLNQCNPVGTVVPMPDLTTADNCYPIKTVYSGGINNARVEFIRIVNGGHGWPSSNKPVETYDPSTGYNCKDFDPATLQWQFFSGFSKP
jgi:polyhydroxybutyrate depolymerase